MNYQVQLTRRAQADIDQAFTWIAKESQAAAAAWHASLLEGISRLETFPKRCPVCERESAFLGVEIRKLIVDRYRVLFKIERPTVYVLTVRHGARDEAARADLE